MKTKNKRTPLDVLVETVTAVAKPEKIILFGSRARDDYHADSDYDLLVVKGQVHRRELAKKIYRQLIGFGWPVDIIVVHPEDIEKYADAPYTVIGSAVEEGKLLYAV